MPITTPQQADALTAVIQQLRPDWQHNGIIRHLHQNRTNPAPYADIVLAAITKAQDPNTRTPALLLLPGDHWPAKSRNLQPAGPPCPDHPEENAHHCRACRSDILAGIRPPEYRGKHYAVPPTW